MDTSTIAPKSLICAAIDALKDAYQESSSNNAKISISKAYTAISLLDYMTGNSCACNDITEVDDSYDPSEYCSAV